MIRRFFDRVQIFLHLLGMHRLATLAGRFGTPEPEVSFYDRPTLEVPVYVAPSQRGANYCLQDENCPMQVLNFDPTFTNNEGIDVSRDIAFPVTKYDIN